MTISIVIPAHNEEELLPLCLEHCASARTAEVCEILVINNASTDATADIARSVPGVRVVDEPQKGLTKARQRGLKEANGDILAYVDADTLISQEWLEAISKVFTESPEVV